MARECWFDYFNRMSNVHHRLDHEDHLPTDYSKLPSLRTVHVVMFGEFQATEAPFHKRGIHKYLRDYHIRRDTLYVVGA